MDDVSTLNGARGLAERIQRFWQLKGRDGIRAWVEPAVERVYTSADEWYPQRFWHVRSNLGRDGFPP